jgi:hypothetical protein
MNSQARAFMLSCKPGRATQQLNKLCVIAASAPARDLERTVAALGLGTCGRTMTEEDVSCVKPIGSDGGVESGLALCVGDVDPGAVCEK